MAATINPNGLLAGQVAVITGASRGIGAAIAYRYAQEGAKVVVSARTLEDGDHVLEGGINSVAATINEAGGSALAVRADLNLENDRVTLIEEARSSFGEVDILVNNGAVTYYDRRLLRQRVVLVDLLMRRFLVCSFWNIN